MDKKIIIFSGMPASGKDTITKLLCDNPDMNFVAFKKHRSVDAGTPKKDTYYNISQEEFEQKINAGDFLQYHSRYNRYYGIDREELWQVLQSGSIPIIHIGRIENFFVFQQNLADALRIEEKECQVIHIMLWEEIDVLKKRIDSREKTDEERAKRMKAMREEFRDNKEMLDRNENPYSYIIKNTDPEKTCQAIREIVEKDDCRLGNGYEEFMRYVLMTRNLNEEGKKNTSNSVSITCRKDISSYKIKDRRFERNVTIENIKGNDTLEFENCVFQDIKLSSINCENVHFVNCSIEGELRIYKGKIQNISIRNCQQITRFVLEEGNTPGTETGMQLKVTSSNIGELKIAATRLKLLDFMDVNSTCAFINFVRGGSVDELKSSCPIEKLLVKELPKIVLSKEGKFSLIELEYIDKKTLRRYEKEIVDFNHNGHMDDDYLRYKSVVLAAYEAFENKKMFQESDICLFEIRRLGILIKKADKALPMKIGYSLSQFLIEYCFGWGINIINNVITMLAVITGFSGLYYGIAKMQGEVGFHFAKCFEIAVNRFFLVGTDEYDYVFLSYMDSLESILAVVLITVITGVLVRKIIR